MKRLPLVTALTAFPWLIVYGGTLIYWPLGLYLLPLFLPTLCHQRSPTGGWSVFIETPWGYVIALLYTLACALIAVYFARGRRTLGRLVVSSGVFVVGAVIVHVSLLVVGYRFYVETP